MNLAGIGVVVAAGIAFFVLLVFIADTLKEGVIQLKRIADSQPGTADKLRDKIGQAYQIVGLLAREADLFEDDEVQEALNHFADPDEYEDISLTPFILARDKQ